MSYLYILNINHLSYISFANSFSHSVSCLLSFFFFFDSSIYCGKRFYIIMFYLFIFTFVYFTCVDKLKKNVSKPSINECIDYAAIFSRSFMISSLISRTFIHFEFILCMVWKNVLILYRVVKISPNHLLNQMYFTHCIFLLFFFLQ